MTPTLTPTETPTETPTHTATVTPTGTYTSTPSNTPTPTSSVTPTTTGEVNTPTPTPLTYLIDFQVVRGDPVPPKNIFSTSTADTSRGELEVVSSESSAGAPIPGLMIEVQVAPPNATATTYEVMTDTEGHPSAAIEVDSSSDIILLSKNPQIAQLEIAAPAIDFAAEQRAKVFATPMVDSLGVCRESLDDGERLRFTYKNLNAGVPEVLIPISSLSSSYYLNPIITTDDLLLNDIRSSLNQPIVPDGQHRTSSSGNTYQTFLPDHGTFTVTYDLREGPLTWSFIGKSLVVDEEVEWCKTEKTPQCLKIPNTNLKAIYREYIKTVRDTLKEGDRSMKRGTGKNLNRTPYATKILKSVVKLISQLKGVHVCDAGAVVPQACQLREFPHARLLKQHAGLFKNAKLTNPKAFERVRLKHYQRFSAYLVSTFPRKVYICPSP
jgi:hypothetical protein